MHVCMCACVHVCMWWDWPFRNKMWMSTVCYFKNRERHKRIVYWIKWFNNKLYDYYGFQMKYEIKSSRESSVKHHGKRDLGWYSISIVFNLLDNEKQPYKNILYLDQKLNETNLWNSGTVVELLEVSIHAIIKVLSFIEDAVLIFNNASCYQKNFLTLMIGLVNQKFYHNLFISFIIRCVT